MIRRRSPLLTTKSKELGKNTTKRDLTLFSGVLRVWSAPRLRLPANTLSVFYLWNSSGCLDRE